MDEADDIYILPHTCLCGNATTDLLDPLNTHRHLIVVFRNRMILNQFNKLTNTWRMRNVPIDGLAKLANDNVDEDASIRLAEYGSAGTIS